jgi:hypothetical protein
MRAREETELSRDFNYILRLLYPGFQWKDPIKKDGLGHLEIHYTYIYRAVRQWQADGCFDAIFEIPVFGFRQDDRLDAAVIHGDGTTTAAKKGGHNLGFSSHKKIKGEKAAAFCDCHCKVIMPFVATRAIAMNRFYCEKRCRSSSASPVPWAWICEAPSCVSMARTIAGCTETPFLTATWFPTSA